MTLKILIIWFYLTHLHLYQKILFHITNIFFLSFTSLSKNSFSDYKHFFLSFQGLLYDHSLTCKRNGLLISFASHLLKCPAKYDPGVYIYIIIIIILVVLCIKTSLSTFRLLKGMNLKNIFEFTWVHIRFIKFIFIFLRF